MTNKELIELLSKQDLDEEVYFDVNISVGNEPIVTVIAGDT